MTIPQLERIKKKHTCSIFVDEFDNKNLHLINHLHINSLYDGNKKFKNQLEDAKIFLSKIKKLPKGIVIVDDYRIGYIWEKLISNYCGKIVSIDDFLYKKHYSDILINSKPDFFNLHSNKIKKIMETVVELEIPNKVDYECGDNWGEIY